MYIYKCNDFRILFFIQTFLKHCKALSTEKYKRYINILLLLLLKLDVNPFLPPKIRRFSLLVGHTIYPSSSSTNQNAALIIDY